MSAPAAEVRGTILEALEDAEATGGLDPARLAGFEEGAEDIALDELGLDSLKRVELLVALEMEYAAVISPDVFARFRTLGDLVAHVEGCGTESDGSEDRGASPQAPDAPADAAAHHGDEPVPHFVRLFRRFFPGCGSVARMNHLLTGFAGRMVPREVASFRAWQRRGALLPADASPKYVEALGEWLDTFERRLGNSGKAEPEPFARCRISPAVMHYYGPGERREKTLLVCFSVMGYHTMAIPQAAFLQHIDATRYDVLIFSDPWNTAYRRGVPDIGGRVMDVVRWVGRLPLVREYAATRTFGCSAGAYPALLTGRYLGAEVSIGMNGRLPDKPRRRRRMYLHSLLSTLRVRRSPVLLTYGATLDDDALFARRIGRLTGASRLEVELPERDLDHNIVQPLLEYGELSDFLARTLFAAPGSPWLVSPGARESVRYPRNDSETRSAPCTVS